MTSQRNSFKDVLLGVAVGDALGVPYEFRSRSSISQNPATGMIGYGTYNLPPGTWSDDSSLTFCLAEAMCGDFTLDAVGYFFRKWAYEAYWTPRGEVFDIGITTRESISRIDLVSRPEYAGATDERSNGNGSLMRILPLLFHVQNMPVSERFEWTRNISSITHRHIRSSVACMYYLEFALSLLRGANPQVANEEVKKTFPEFIRSIDLNPREAQHFNRLLNDNIAELPEEKIFSSGYVIHTLEAAIWCLLTTTSYRDAVLAAVNLGEDTDTTAAVTGGLAGLFYGHEAIPPEWIQSLARLDDIEDLARRMEMKYN